MSSMDTDSDLPVHRQLFEKLNENIDQGLLEAIKKKLILKGMKKDEANSLLCGKDIFRRLQEKELLSPRNYRFLREVFEDVSAHDLIKLIYCAELKMGKDVSDSVSIDELKRFEEEVSVQIEPPENNNFEKSPRIIGLLQSSNIYRNGNGNYNAPPTKAAMTELGQYTSGKGYLLLINQFTSRREGTKADELQLMNFFVETLQYQYKYLSDVSWSQLERECQVVAQELSNNTYECFVCAILSHGDENGIKMYEDNSSVPPAEIVSIFSSLPALYGKPKVFIIQACRGKERNTVPDNVEAEDVEPQLQPSPPRDADVLIAFSTTKGYEAMRNRERGSWFVQTLCDVLKDNYREYDSDKILKLVNCRVATEMGIPDPAASEKIIKQMPVYESTLTKDLYFSAPS